MDYHKLEKIIETYVTGLFDQAATGHLIYHNLDHTQQVVKNMQEIAGHYNITSRDMLVLYTAAWFHDTGYLFTNPSNHEQYSVDIMKKFMSQHITDQSILDDITKCILATRMPTHPQNLLEEIICDADSFHLGSKTYKNCRTNCFEEEKIRDSELTYRKFLEDTVTLFKSHEYYTSYSKENLVKQKQKNLRKVEKKLKEEIDVVNESTKIGDFHNMDKGMKSLVDKGIQTMLRVTSRNHLELSEMADKKANILISVNAIIISVILSVLVRKLQEETYLVIPTIIFLAVSVTTIVISILATRPKISGGTFTLEEVKKQEINLLFFGNFHKVSYEQYDEAMKELMLDPNYLYSMLIKDIYSLGVVLGRKYKLIRLAYNIFMIGIIVSVIAFGIAVFLAGNNDANHIIIREGGSPF